VPSSGLRLNPFEIDRLGVPDGGTVRVTGARSSLTLPVVADPGLPRGSAALAFNVGLPGAADLIDATTAVTEVRVETL
jgi:anaerobic selenocysteine-containing dehydrogenase